MLSFAETLRRNRSSNNGVTIKKRCYTNLSSYEVGILFAFEYYTKKIIAGKDISVIDVKTVSYASYNEVIKFIHDVDKENYYTAWLDAKDAMLSNEKLFVSD